MFPQWFRSKQHVKAVEALRAELEEEEQALGGTEAGSVSGDAQSEEGSSQAEFNSAQQASAAGDADCDEGHASPPDLTCMLTTNPCTPSKLCCTRRKTCRYVLYCTSAMFLPSVILVST